MEMGLPTACQECSLQMAVEDDAKSVLQAQILHFYKEQELGYCQKIMLSSLFRKAKARDGATTPPNHRNSNHEPTPAGLQCPPAPLTGYFISQTN